MESDITSGNEIFKFCRKFTTWISDESVDIFPRVMLLQKMWLVRQSGYLRNGKQWGLTVRIISGLNISDFISFPYHLASQIQVVLRKW